MYCGKETAYDQTIDGGQSEKIFEYLLRPIGSGHHIFADRYYTIHSLITYLSEKRTYYTGTLMTNRKNFPAEVKNSKLQHLEAKWFRSESGIICNMWKDKKASKPVIAVSTYSEKDTTDVTSKRGVVTNKPTMINDYNKFMNGCDRGDQMVSYYNDFNRKTIKWWKRILMWCLEVSQVNSYILYCLTREVGHKGTSLLEYKKTLISELCAEANQIKPNDHKDHVIVKPNVKHAVRMPGTQHIVVHSPVDRACVVCSTPASRKRTKFKCSTCDCFLHPKDCFLQFHEKP